MPTSVRRRAASARSSAPLAPPSRATAVPPEPSAPLPARAAAFRSLLRPLGIVGYDAVEPALLAALATEEPLLLVSDHGAAKTLLLVRLAEALGLALRHYNASLLQFDDLAGFPVPDDRGGIRYVAPAGAIWDAEIVFLDEIGRCRPETANKLFPIVHERRVQGARLERLRHRWAATNPPPEAQEPADAADACDPYDGYQGVEPLDPALADRFAYVVPLPRFADLSDADRALIVGGAGERPAPNAPAHVRELVAATRALLPTVEASLGEAVTRYVLALLPRLAAAGLAAGGRRAAALRRNVLAVRAACLALGAEGDERACCTALLASVPDVVRRRVSRAVLLAAHEAAWRETRMPEADPRRVLLAVRDPARRATLAVTLPELRADLRGEALCGALAELPAHEAEILAWHLLPRLLAGDVVPATAIETVAEIVERVARGGAEVRGFGTQREWALAVRTRLAASPVPATEVEYLHGVLVRAFNAPQAVTGLDPSTGVAARVRQCLDFRARCLAALGTLDAPEQAREEAR